MNISDPASEQIDREIELYEKEVLLIGQYIILTL